MLIHPSLSDVLSSDLWILGCSFWFGIRRSAHDAIQSIFAVAVTLRQPIDRSDWQQEEEQKGDISTSLLFQEQLFLSVLFRDSGRNLFDPY